MSLSALSSAHSASGILLPSVSLLRAIALYGEALAGLPFIQPASISLRSQFSGIGKAVVCFTCFSMKLELIEAI
ncbi:MAG: hypothetical protein HOJ07_00235 [Rhodospirillaceae bacterium]|nr:hypothetical protein [Rhodospirillaceae bacterium]